MGCYTHCNTWLKFTKEQLIGFTEAEVEHRRLEYRQYRNWFQDEEARALFALFHDNINRSALSLNDVKFLLRKQLEKYE